MCLRWDTWPRYFTGRYARRDTWPIDFQYRRGPPGTRSLMVARDHQYARRGTWCWYYSQCAWRETWPLYYSADWESSGNRWPFKGGRSRQWVHFRGIKIFLKKFFLEQRPDPSSFRQASRHISSTELSPSSARHDSHFCRASSNSPSLPHVPSGFPCQPASWPNLIHADLLKAHEGYSLEMSSRIERRSRIEGAPPAKRVDEQDTTPKRVSVKQNFAERSLSWSERTSPVGSLGHLRKVSRQEGSSTR